MKFSILRFGVIVVLLALTLACAQTETPIPLGDDALTASGTPTSDRESLIPPAPGKITPAEDVYPPQSVTSEYEDPIPLPYPVNTAGGEDSPFIVPDGNTLYLWFTPDVSKLAEEQLTDGVTGIYVFHKTSGGWSAAERVMLQDPEKLALDGCGFVQNDIIWFCSAREGYTGIRWFTAEFVNGMWTNWQLADFDPNYEVGELHITADGRELYFHSSRPGGKGGYDIWVSKKVNGEWQEPINVAVVNSSHTDGWPFVTQDDSALWFTRVNGGAELWRSVKIDGQWSEPEQMFTHFAGEPSLDNEGNVYFVHHFFRDGVMLEADIYMARKNE